MTDHVDCIVIGAGVIGLAIARALALAGREVVVLERAGAIGTETSSRNSEVVHAGLYYPRGSLKATLCVAGREALYAFCASHGVPVARTGKLVVATADDEVASLAALAQRARDNGVGDVELIDAATARHLEPALACRGALLSPSTGIIDSHALMLALQGDAEAHGAVVALRTAFVGATAAAGRLCVEAAAEGAEPIRLTCRALVNAAGLAARQVALAITGMPPAVVPPAYYAKGSYFALAGRAPFKHLIYPVPEAGGLGVHLTLDLAGMARFGPDVEWLTRLEPDSYDVDAARAAAFYPAIRRYYPDLTDGALQPAYAGVRPKIAAPGAAAADFVIQGPAAHGVPGLVNLFGIESPGLTASLAIAAHVAALVDG